MVICLRTWVGVLMLAWNDCLKEIATMDRQYVLLEGSLSHRGFHELQQDPCSSLSRWPGTRLTWSIWGRNDRLWHTWWLGDMTRQCNRIGPSVGHRHRRRFVLNRVERKCRRGMVTGHLHVTRISRVTTSEGGKLCNWTCNKTFN